jgi:hypothetical protein
MEALEENEDADGRQGASESQSPDSPQKDATALKQLLQRLRFQAAKSTTKALVGDRAELLGHRESVLFLGHPLKGELPDAEHCRSRFG